MEMERKYEQLEILKDSDKSRIALVYDAENRRMAVEKHLRGELPVYRRLQEFSHPYLPKIYEIQILKEETIVWEEYITGGSLEQIPVGEKQVSRWLLELCDVFSFLHRQGILHRDLKPSNILLGEDGHIRLIDFDAAREPKPGQESDTRLLGTKGFAPPEQYGFSQTSVRSDIYAFGKTAGQLLGNAARKKRWDHILKKCTALDPKRRYSDIRLVKLAIWRGKLWRWIFRPVCGVLAAFFLLFWTGSYLLDTDFRTALQIVTQSKRTAVFDTVNLEQLQQSDVALEKYTGEINSIYMQLQPQIEGRLISTGFADENGNLLFGIFSISYEIETGKTIYREFQGLCTIDRRIPKEEWEQYAPAILALYELDIFDTLLK